MVVATIQMAGIPAGRCFQNALGGPIVHEAPALSDPKAEFGEGEVLHHTVAVETTLDDRVIEVDRGDLDHGVATADHLVVARDAEGDIGLPQLEFTGIEPESTKLLVQIELPYPLVLRLGGVTAMWAKCYIITYLLMSQYDVHC